MSGGHSAARQAARPGCWAAPSLSPARCTSQPPRPHLPLQALPRAAHRKLELHPGQEGVSLHRSQLRLQRAQRPCTCLLLLLLLLLLLQRGGQLCHARAGAERQAQACCGGADADALQLSHELSLLCLPRRLRHAHLGGRQQAAHQRLVLRVQLRLLRVLHLLLQLRLLCVLQLLRLLRVLHLLLQLHLLCVLQLLCLLGACLLRLMLSRGVEQRDALLRVEKGRVRCAALDRTHRLGRL